MGPSVGGTGVGVDVDPGTGVRVGVVVGTGEPPCEAVSSTRTQSPAPSALLLGGVNCRVPVLAKGDPAMATYVPLEGSYHLAVADPDSLVMSTVRVLRVGM